MSLRKLVAFSALTIASASAIAGTADFTQVMSNSPSANRVATTCETNLGAKPDVGSHFQSDMLASATTLKAASSTCHVGVISYSASNSHNLFSAQPKSEPTAIFARFTLMDDSHLLSNKTALQAAVTR